MATLYAKTAGGNWSDAGTWSSTSASGVDSAGPPTAADDVIFEALSGNVTINSAAVCRSLDTTSGTGSYEGTITHNAGVTLTIGDGTAGAGNVALKFNSAITYTLGNASTSAIAFVSTSATQQTITTAGKTLGNITFNSSSNGDYALVDNTTLSATATLTVTKGTFHADGASDNSGLTHSWGIFNSSNSNVRTVNLGASQITMTGTSSSWVISTVTNLTFSAGFSTVTFNQSGFSGTTFLNTGSVTFYDLVFSGAGQQRIIVQSGSTLTCHNFTRTGTAAKTDGMMISTGNLTVTNELTINGNSETNRMFFFGFGNDVARTVSAGTVSVANTDFKDIAATGSGDWDLSSITGKSGDCGGNTGITFTAAATQYWKTTTTGTKTWSTAANWFLATNGVGAGRVPLPQDDVVFDANSIGAGSTTISQDMPRAGKSINFTGVTNTPTFSMSSAASIFGSLTLVAGMAISGTGTYTFEGKGAYTLTSAGQTFAKSITINNAGGSLTLQDALASGSTNTLTVTAGTFSAGGFNVTFGLFNSNVSNTRTITMGAGTWTLTAAGTPWNIATITGLTLNQDTSTVKFTDTSSSSATFAGGGETYYNIWFARGAGTGSNILTGSNTFNNFKDDGSAAHSIIFTAGTTTTITTWTVVGSSGNVITINSDTTATHSLVKSGGGYISSDYLNIQHSVATPGVTWYAGANSTNNQAVATAGSGWIFTPPVSPSASLSPSSSTSPSSSNSPSLSPSASLSPSSSISASESPSSSTSPSSSRSPSSSASASLSPSASRSPSSSNSPSQSPSASLSPSSSDSPSISPSSSLSPSSSISASISPSASSSPSSSSSSSRSPSASRSPSSSNSPSVSPSSSTSPSSSRSPSASNSPSPSISPSVSPSSSYSASPSPIMHARIPLAVNSSTRVPLIDIS